MLLGLQKCSLVVGLKRKGILSHGYVLIEAVVLIEISSFHFLNWNFGISGLPFWGPKDHYSAKIMS